MSFEKITESASHYRDLDLKSVREILVDMNREDQSVPMAVERCIPAIEQFVEKLVPRMREGGRLFYVGAGTSGRLGVVDASECPPTFGVSDDWVIGIIAGGDIAVRKSVEDAEDDTNQAWRDLQQMFVNEQDIVIGITASGTTPYVVHGLKDCRANGVTTGCITCNPGMPVAQYADFPVEVITGPEFVTGSTRMKAGTAQKMILNMISTSVMIRLGRVLDNKMVDMQLNNAKLVDRGVKMLMQAKGLSYEAAADLLERHGSVRKAMTQ